MGEIYLDNNSTTLLRPPLQKRLGELLASPLGNPASPHSWGDRAARLLSQARTSVGEFLWAEPEHFFFTSGGSESNTQVLRSFSTIHKGRVRYITSAVEHSSILNYMDFLSGEGHTVDILPVDPQGIVPLDVLREALNRDMEVPTLVSIQWVNNETGVIQDIPSLATLSKAQGAFFHTDAAQAVGKLSIFLRDLPIDFLTFTGHKVHGPAGVGVVYARNPRTLVPLIGGGGQESGLRPGTPNLLGIILLGEALEDRRAHWEEHLDLLKCLRDRFESQVLNKLPETRINGGGTRRVGNTSNLRFPDLDGRALVARLDQEGVICSQHSACTSQIPEPSHVLTAMGLEEEEAWGSIRFSVSVDNTLEQMDQAAEIVVQQVCQLQEWSRMMNFSDRQNIPAKFAEK